MNPESCAHPVSPLGTGIPGGEYWIGDDSGRPDERPAHCVELAPFWVARIPVTNRDYGQYLAVTGCELPRFWHDPDFARPEQPVVGVRWSEARDYCDWLSSCFGRRYRLPSEAEWEVAALGGHAGASFSWGSMPPEIGGTSLANLPQSAPATAGLSPPNDYGLCDLGFNVHEWCLDWYDARYYASSPRANPLGPHTGERRSSRGGAWRHQIKVSRCAARSSLPPDFRYNDYGFRLFADG